MPNLNYKFLECIKKMPPMYHKIPNEPFNVMNSQVAAYIASQPEVLQKLFDMAKNKGVIKFDADTKKWRGVDYDD